MGLGDLFDNIKYKIEEIGEGLENVKDNLEYLADDIKDGLENIKDNVSYKIDEIKEGLENIDENLKDTLPGYEQFRNIAEKASPLFFGKIFTVMPTIQIIKLLKELGKRVFAETVEPEKGSILICKIVGGNFEHSGVYIGDGEVVELAGNGEIRKVTMAQFLNDGLTRTGSGIYVACDKDDEPVYSSEVAERALSMIGKWRDYNVLTDNCHQFTAGCITGEFENPVNFFWLLENEIKNEMNYGESIRWHLCYGKYEPINTYPIIPNV